MPVDRCAPDHHLRQKVPRIVLKDYHATARLKDPRKLEADPTSPRWDDVMKYAAGHNEIVLVIHERQRPA
jgi:hypothetical protein